jgi:DNA-binding PucR family transcriptional regulator
MFATLEQFFQPIMSQIDKLMGNPTVEGIEKIREQLKTTVLFDVAKLRRHYGELLKAYYDKHEPFNNHNHNHNQEASQSIDESFAKDFEDFIELVSFSTEADDTSILDEWAIDYPCKNKKVLAKDLSAYVNAFQGIVTDWEGFMTKLQARGQSRCPDETKPYWAYLVNKLSSKL